MHTLRDLLIIEAQDLHAGETLFARALPRIAESVRAESLHRALVAQHAEGRAQVARLGQVLAMLGAAPGDDDCEAMEGIVAQAEELMEDDLPGALLDAALLVTTIKVKHFEIASYRALVAMAEACGAAGASALLQESLAEETRAEAALGRLGGQEVHARAAELSTQEMDR